MIWLLVLFICFSFFVELKSSAISSLCLMFFFWVLLVTQLSFSLKNFLILNLGETLLLDSSIINFFFTFLFLFVTVYFWQIFFSKMNKKMEFATLIFFILVLGLLLFKMNNFLEIFVVIEALSFIAYILAGFEKDTKIASSVGIQYLIIGSISSIFLALSFILVYNQFSTTTFLNLLLINLNFFEEQFFSMNSASFFIENNLIFLSIFNLKNIYTFIKKYFVKSLTLILSLFMMKSNNIKLDNEKPSTLMSGSPFDGHFKNNFGISMEDAVIIMEKKGQLLAEQYSFIFFEWWNWKTWVHGSFPEPNSEAYNIFWNLVKTKIKDHDFKFFFNRDYFFEQVMNHYTELKVTGDLWMYDGWSMDMQVETEVINFFNDWAASPGNLSLGYKVKHHYSSENFPFTYKSSDELVYTGEPIIYSPVQGGVTSQNGVENETESSVSTEISKSEKKNKKDDDSGDDSGGSSYTEESSSPEGEVETTSVEDTVNSIIAELFDFNSEVLSNTLFLNLEQWNFSIYGTIIIVLSFLIGTLFYKIKGAPFHIWAPTVYTRMPTGSMIILVTIFTLIFSLYFFQLFFKIFYLYSNFFSQFFILGGILSLIFGFLGAFDQKILKKFFIYSSIGHVAFLLFSFIAPYTFQSGTSLLMYLLIYLVSTFLLWFLITHNTKKIEFLSNLLVNIKENSLYFFLFVIIIFSMSGIPPLAGFFIKFDILSILALSNEFLILFITLLITVASFYYYLRLVKISSFENFKSYLLQFLKIESFWVYIRLVFLFVFIMLLLFFPIIFEQSFYYVLSFIF